MVEDLLTNDTIASLTSEDETPLHVAARSGHSEVVKVLIDWRGIMGEQTLTMRNMR